MNCVRKGKAFCKAPLQVALQVNCSPVCVKSGGKMGSSGWAQDSSWGSRMDVSILHVISHLCTLRQDFGLCALVWPGRRRATPWGAPIGVEKIPLHLTKLSLESTGEGLNYTFIRRYRATQEGGEEPDLSTYNLGRGCGRMWLAVCAVKQNQR